MKVRYLIIAVCVFIFGCSERTEASHPENVTGHNNKQEVTFKKELPTNKVEMVFCLDATGSMGGLIGTAKEKIWAIVSEVVQDTVPTEVRLGMVFYRDRGDAFVTQKIKLTDDIDSVYSELLSMTAQGGGDSPESVNQGLYEAITENDWSTSQDVYKTIFVVGDCPPHMDYNEVRYTESCKMAQKKGIVINTIKLGSSCADAIPHFKAMASCSGGEYLNLGQNANDIVIETPYDQKINDLSKSIDESKVYYGSEEEKKSNTMRKNKSIALYEKSSAASTSDRVTYNTSKTGKKNWMGSKEFIADYSDGDIELEDIEVSDLPDEYAGKTTEEIKADLEQKVKERKQSVNELKELSQKRTAYIKAEKEKLGEEESFSENVNTLMKEQRKK